MAGLDTAKFLIVQLMYRLYSTPTVTTELPIFILNAELTNQSKLGQTIFFCDVYEALLSDSYLIKSKPKLCVKFKQT